MGSSATSLAVGMMAETTYLSLDDKLLRKRNPKEDEK
jgi:hypothetical protein